MVTRRSFLKAGFIGAIALAAAGGIYRTMTSSPTVKFALDANGKTALRAIATVMMNGAMPALSTQVMDAQIMRVQGAIAGLPLQTQKEIQDLFSLLLLAPTRRFLAGIPDDWAQAKPDDIAAFLQNWRTHRLGMLQSAYHALHDLIIGSWYANESTWSSIGYPGPTRELS